MFTLADIRNIAVQIERNGEESYRSAGRMAKDPEIAEIMNWMADEEKCHAEWFENLRSDKPLTAEQQELEAMGRSLLQEMIRGNTFLLDQGELQDIRTLAEVIDRSQTLEQDTILFYEFLLGLIDNRETAVQLEKIIEEERNHLRRLTRMAEEPSPSTSGLCAAEPG